MPTEIIVRTIFAGAFQYASGKVVAREQAHQSLAPGDTITPREGQHDRDHDGTGMPAAAEVVELESMRGRSVDESGLRGRQAIAAAPEHAATGGGLATNAGRSNRGLHDVRLRAGDAGRQRVQQEALGEPKRLARNIL